MTNWDKPGGICPFNFNPCVSGFTFDGDENKVSMIENAGPGMILLCFLSTCLVWAAPIYCCLFCASTDTSGIFCHIEEGIVHCKIRRKYACGSEPDIKLYNISYAACGSQKFQSEIVDEEGNKRLSDPVTVYCLRIDHMGGSWNSPNLIVSEQVIQDFAKKINELVKKTQQAAIVPLEIARLEN